MRLGAGNKNGELLTAEPGDDVAGPGALRLRRHHTLPSDQLLDAVLADLLGPQPDDDAAVLAVRFIPGDSR